MRALIQRVSSASVQTQGEELRAIGPGYVVLLGVGPEDDVATAERLWSKIRRLRIFPDEQGKTNQSLTDVGGSVLLVSQFTLYADCRRGNRPSFTKGATPDKAEQLYEQFANLVRKDNVSLQCGWFGAEMQVSLVNDGPFTIVLDTDDLA